MGKSAATNGLQNETNVATLITNHHPDVLNWFKTIGYDVSKAEEIFGVIHSGHGKTDISAYFKIPGEPGQHTLQFSVKQFQTTAFNQLHKTWLATYAAAMGWSDAMQLILAKALGLSVKRVGCWGLTDAEQDQIRGWFADPVNARKFVEYIFLGDVRGLEPQGLILIQGHIPHAKAACYRIQDVIDKIVPHIKVVFTKTVCSLGAGITLQRKGGDGGEDSANQMQVKCALHELIKVLGAKRMQTLSSIEGLILPVRASSTPKAVPSTTCSATPSVSVSSVIASSVNIVSPPEPEPPVQLLLKL